MKKKSITREFIFKEASRLNRSTDENSNLPVAVLLTSVVKGPNVKEISKFLRIKRELVAKYSKNLRRNKVWVGDKIHSDYFEKKGLGVISLFLDANIALGYVKRV